MPKPVRVVPAILTDSPGTLDEMLGLVKTFTDYAQIDIMDGQFVPSRSINWQILLSAHVEIKWEAHLMVEKPENQIANFKRAGAQKVVFHFESTSNPHLAISLARKMKLEIGLAVNPETPVTAILPLVSEVDSLLFLSVHPGFYGSKFLPEVLEKVQELRRLHPEASLGIDGGIKDSNISEIARSGVDEIFVGSAILLACQPAEAYQELLARARQAQE